MDNPRIEDLRRRIQKDPASIAFAQLAEEYRRAGRSRDAIDACRTGLKHHPGYLSARVTLGRALVETGEFEEAERELKEVLRLAPENLAALRGLAEAIARRGDEAAALTHYEAALALAPRDLELQHTVASLRERLHPSAPAQAAVAGPGAGGGPEPTGPPAGVVSAASDAAVPQTVAAPMPAAAPAKTPGGAAALLPVLERWLAFIVADRAERAHQAASNP